MTHLHHEVCKSKFDCKWLIVFYQGNKFSQSLDKYNKNHLTNAKTDYFFYNYIGFMLLMDLINSTLMVSLRKHPFLLAFRRWGNQCLHNKSGSHGVPNVNLSNFAFLLVDFGKVLC